MSAYDDRKERERSADFDERDRGPGHERYEEALDRWRDKWNHELEEDEQ